MTEHHLLVVLSNGAPGHEDEYNDWYDNEHLDDLVEIPGIRSAQRLEYSGLSTVPYADQDPHSSRKYLALYEIDGDPEATVKAIIERREAGSFVVSEHIADVSSWLFSPRTPVHRRKGT